MREKKPIAYAEAIKQKAKNLMEDFHGFTDGVRLVFLIHRNKEGGETNNTKTRKIITTNSKEFETALLELLQMQQNSEIPYRIYSSVNSRDIEKAIRKFKIEQLEADYYDTEQKHQFYLDIKNRWVGCLMQPAQKNTSFFIFDVDTKDDGEALIALNGIPFVKKYSTKNGWHIVTEPFNYTTIKLPKDVEIQKDGLLLLSY